MKSVLIALFAGVIASAQFLPVTAADAARYKHTVIYSFCSEKHCTDGRYPIGDLIYVNGMLYGATHQGGGAGNLGAEEGCDYARGCGTVFSLDPVTNAHTVIYAFCRGVTGRCVDGAHPNATMIGVNGILYGTTASGGSGKGCETFGCGTVFSLDPNTGVEKVIYSFAGGVDGQQPNGLAELNGVLYGTTQFGGGAGCTGRGCGILFSVDPATGVEKVLHTFCSQPNCDDGLWPMSSVIAANGMLYGTTVGGGGGAQCEQSLGCGAIFSANPETGSETVLYSFCGQASCADGAGPNGVTFNEGKLYGTTYEGGSHNCSASCGVIFSFDANASVESVLYTFQGGVDGRWPDSSLIAVQGKLYGSTTAGGANFNGAVFSYDLKAATQSVIYSFCAKQSCTDGEMPRASLAAVGDDLFGMTSEGGDFCRNMSGCGTAFVLQKRH